MTHWFRPSAAWRARFHCPECGWKPYPYGGVCHNPRCSRYLRGKRLRFKAGSHVVVKQYPRAVRTVECVYTDIDGGRRLDAPVDGFVSWNVTDLRSERRRTR